MTRWLLAGLLALVLTLPVSAAAFDFGVPAQFGMHDSQLYFQSFSRAQTYLGTGGYYGPVFTLTHNGQWMGDVLGVGGWGNAQLEGDDEGSKLSGSFGLMLLNFWGLQAGVAYNPTAKTADDDFADRLSWGVGLSLTGVWNQLTQPAPVE